MNTGAKNQGVAITLCPTTNWLERKDSNLQGELNALSPPSKQDGASASSATPQDYFFLLVRPNMHSNTEKPEGVNGVD